MWWAPCLSLRTLVSKTDHTWGRLVPSRLDFAMRSLTRSLTRHLASMLAVSSSVPDPEEATVMRKSPYHHPSAAAINGFPTAPCPPPTRPTSALDPPASFLSSQRHPCKARGCHFPLQKRGGFHPMSPCSPAAWLGTPSLYL